MNIIEQWRKFILRSRQIIIKINSYYMILGVLANKIILISNIANVAILFVSTKSIRLASKIKFLFRCISIRETPDMPSRRRNTSSLCQTRTWTESWISRKSSAKWTSSSAARWWTPSEVSTTSFDNGSRPREDNAKRRNGKQGGGRETTNYHNLIIKEELGIQKHKQFLRNTI